MKSASLRIIVIIFASIIIFYGSICETETIYLEKETITSINSIDKKTTTSTTSTTTYYDPYHDCYPLCDHYNLPTNCDHLWSLWQKSCCDKYPEHTMCQPTTTTTTTTPTTTGCYTTTTATPTQNYSLTQPNIYLGGFNHRCEYKGWWLRKLDTLFHEDYANWNITYGGDNRNDQIYDLATDSAGNIYAVGYVDGTTKGWGIRKFQPDGTEFTSWHKVYDGGTVGYATSIAIDPFDNVYVTGCRTINSTQNWWIKKFDSSGTEDTTNWNKTIVNSFGNDCANAIAIDNNNDVYVAGHSFNGTNSDWCIRKFTPEGTSYSNWVLVIDGNNDNDEIMDIAIDSQNYVYFVGNRINLNNYWWVKKFNHLATEDTTNWNITYDSGPSGSLNAITLDNNDNVYLAGSIFSLNNYDTSWWIKKLDNNGIEDSNWNKVIADSHTAYDVALDNNGYVYVIGSDDEKSDPDTSGGWMIKQFINGVEHNSQSNNDEGYFYSIVLH